MPPDPEEQALACMRSFVVGDDEVSTVFSCLREVPKDEMARVFRSHRSEFEAIDAARAVILESVMATGHKADR